MQVASKKASNRKEAAVSFLKLAASGKVDEAYGSYIGANFRHHNPYFRGDAESRHFDIEPKAFRPATPKRHTARWYHCVFI